MPHHASTTDALDKHWSIPSVLFNFVMPRIPWKPWVLQPLWHVLIGWFLTLMFVYLGSGAGPSHDYVTYFALLILLLGFNSQYLSLLTSTESNSDEPFIRFIRSSRRAKSANVSRNKPVTSKSPIVNVFPTSSVESAISRPNLILSSVAEFDLSKIRDSFCGHHQPSALQSLGCTAIQ